MLVHLLITLVILGVVLYLVKLLPMDAAIKQIINIVVVIAVIIWLLKVAGLY